MKDPWHPTSSGSCTPDCGAPAASVPRLRGVHVTTGTAKDRPSPLGRASRRSVKERLRGAPHSRSETTGWQTQHRPPRRSAGLTVPGLQTTLRPTQVLFAYSKFRSTQLTSYARHFVAFTVTTYERRCGRVPDLITRPFPQQYE